MSSKKNCVLKKNQIAKIRRKGGFIVVMGDGSCHLADGTLVNRKLVKTLIKEGYLISQNDGLLPDCPQTFTLKKALPKPVIFATSQQGDLDGLIDQRNQESHSK